jgi:hypothetical protein
LEEFSAFNLFNPESEIEESSEGGELFTKEYFEN